MKRLSFELGEEYIGEDSFLTKPENDGEREEAHRELSRALMKLMDEGLTRRQKQCLLLYYRDGLTVTEISKKLQVSPSTVSRTVNRARRNLAGAVSRAALRRLIGED